MIELGTLPEKISFAKDYFEFLDLPEEMNGKVSYTQLNDKIEIKNVCFSYPNSKQYAVNNISFVIKKYEKVAILGENGSGKTTISKLILGLYPTQGGDILYDGKSVSIFDKTTLYKKVSAIAQNFVSYLSSLRENVAISDTDLLSDDERIKASLDNTGLTELYQKNKGLETLLGKEFGGIELSGGQWQKLAIARGMFKDSELILLDEPTSAIDPLIEAEILKNFIRISENKTAIIISHRVGLCTLVDKIVVMKEGMIVEVGTHNDLIKKNGEYTRLYNAQRQWYI